ncbi:MAG: FAD-dependent oxidoreductase [Desulfobacteraceae bacterium]|nr:FAD-dependent oxidoreductase [Desulfobacteraceae bacterium]
MTDGLRPANDRTAQAVLEQARARLEEIFRRLEHEVPLILFTSRIREDPYTQGARQVIRAIRELTPKVTLREYDLGHELARKWEIKHAPTLLFDPDHFKIRWLGAPLGEEGRTFVEAVIMLGYRETHLSEAARQELARIAEPRQVLMFVSPTCPYCPQQAVNALKAAIERPGLISLEIIDVQVSPEIADLYNAHSVPQVIANGKLIAAGAQSEELFVASLRKLEQQRVFIPESDAEEVATDLVIVGGGPAGLTAGIYAERSGLKSVVVERGPLGGQVATTPMVENYPGFSQVGGKTLVDIMVSHALEYTTIFQGEEVMAIEPGEPIVVRTTRRRLTARAVLLATGATYRRLDVPGEARLMGRGVSYCSTCDGPLFSGRRVIMVGGGNSAVTEALHLKNIGVEVSIVHRGPELRAQNELVRSLKEAAIPVVYQTVVEEIRGTAQVEAVLLRQVRTGERREQPVEGVFVAIGYLPAVDLARRIGAEITPEGYVKRDERHRTTVPGIYSAGDVEGGYKQIVTAAGMGAEAALAIFEDLVNPYWKRARKEEVAASG